MMPLATGARVLVTRPVQQADNLCELIINQGGEPILFPTLLIKIAPSTSNRKDLLNAISNSNWVIFVSANAVQFAHANLADYLPTKTARFAAIGKATARALTAVHWSVDLLPDGGFNSEALLASQNLQCVSGQKISIIKGLGGRNKLAQTLRLRGAKVDCLALYQRAKPIVSKHTIKQIFVDTRLDVIVLTSGEAAQNLVAIVGEKNAQNLKSVPLVVISERIKKIASTLGFKQIIVAQEPDDIVIVQTIKTLLNGEWRE